MTLETIYQKIKKSIIAFVPSCNPEGESSDGYRFPPIIGTGFAIREDGLVATSHHVVAAFADVWRPQNHDRSDWGIDAMLLYPAEKGIIDIRIPVAGIINIGGSRRIYGPETPDLSIVRVLANDLAPMKIAPLHFIREGVDIATAGYPMGRRALDGPYGQRQVTPTLQKGIISAVLPFPSERPHSFSVNIMSNSGASGSPVFFTDTGEVSGVLFSALADIGHTKEKDEYFMPTSISYAVPSYYLSSALSKIEGFDSSLKNKIKSLEKIICESLPDAVYHDGVCYHNFSNHQI